MKALRAAYALVSIALYAHSARAGDCFSDESLLKLSAPQRPVLIYVWSPRMVYSVHNMALASRAAAISGMEFVVLHDARVPPHEIAQLPWPPATVQRIEIHADTDLATPPFVPPTDGSQALCAPTLLERDALRHFPTAFVITKRGIHPHPIVGAMPLAAWQQSIAQRLQP